MTIVRSWTSALLAASALSLTAAAAYAQSEDVPTEEADHATFWQDREHVEVLRARLYEKSGRMQLGLYGGVIPNDAFAQFFPVGARWSMYFQETLALEVSGSYAFGRATNLDAFITENADETDNYDYLDWRANAAVLWAPFYGKFSFIGRKIAHFDWSFALGGGVASTSTEESVAGIRESSSAMLPELVIGTGWNFWINENLVARMDYRLMAHMTPDHEHVEGGLETPSELSLGIGYFF